MTDDPRTGAATAVTSQIYMPDPLDVIDPDVLDFYAPDGGRRETSWVRFVPKGDGAPLLIGHHFSKTGGTSIIRHAHRSLTLRGIYTYGPATNRQRRANGQPLLHELPRRRLDDVRVFTGHSLTRQAVNRFVGRDALLFTIVRDPFDRFASVYKHRWRTRPERHRPTPERLFEVQPPNPFASELLRRFAPPGADVNDWPTVIQALARFDVVLTTEHIDAQNGHLFAHIGMPGTTERARVYPEVPDLDEVTRERVYERDAVDRRIHERATAAWAQDGILQAFRPLASSFTNGQPPPTEGAPEARGT